MNREKLVVSLFTGALPLILIAAGCSSTINNGVNRDAGGNDTSSGGGASCTTASKCPADPPATASEIQACQSSQNDPICGSSFTVLLNCAYANQQCDSSGHTMQITTCNAQATAYAQCLGRETDGGIPPFEAGPPGEGGTCTLSPADCTCDMNPSGGACVRCCQTDHTTGTATFIAAVKGCECGGAGACQTQCAATYCATPPVMSDPTCTACIQATLVPGGTCEGQVSSACSADADCTAYLACGNGCPSTP